MVSFLIVKKYGTKIFSCGLSWALLRYYHSVLHSFLNHVSFLDHKYFHSASPTGRLFREKVMNDFRLDELLCDPAFCQLQQ